MIDLLTQLVFINTPKQLCFLKGAKGTGEGTERHGHYGYHKLESHFMEILHMLSINPDFSTTKKKDFPGYTERIRLKCRTNQK